MAFRFFRRIRIAPGVTLNVSKSGPSLSLGPRGAKMTVGPRGTRLTGGLPGTGLHYTRQYGHGSSGGRRGPSTIADGQTETNLTLGFFQRLTTPADEQSLVAGMREMSQQNDEAALVSLRKATHLADGAFLAGIVAMKRELWAEATQHFTRAIANHRQLGNYFTKYGIHAAMALPITEHVSAIIQPTLRGVLLAQTEIWQEINEPREALACLQRLRKLEPGDPVVLLSFVELLLDEYGQNRDACQRVVRLTHDITNETEIHAAILLYKARALRTLGLDEAARDALTLALRRRKDRPPELLHALRYERALTYEALGRNAQARNDFERLYAKNPGYEDVAKRLGV